VTSRQKLLARLAVPGSSKIVLLILDGVGDIRTAAQPETALDRAAVPHLDALAARGALGRLVPVATGITPGSGPGHLALFGYDPTEPEADIGRGVLEALGDGVEIAPGDVAARGNFATLDTAGKVVDRRAGRITTAECERIVGRLQPVLERFPGVAVFAGEGHRFVVHLKGPGPKGLGLTPDVTDSDPQALGVAPLEITATSPAGEETARRLVPALAAMNAAIADEPKANGMLLRGFAGLPHLPQLGEMHQLRCGAFAGYPLYRGAAKACGMEIVPCGKSIGETVDAVAAAWDRFDLFFLHVKKTDQAGEDGDLGAKVAALEEVDAVLPRLLALAPDVIAVTGDHSTPAPMKAHSWHPVPLLVAGPQTFVDLSYTFTEAAAIGGGLGTFPASELMGLLLANAGRLAKYGA
jgi:2,3-bisphosphoglycerate-independent phosphoglycerate mutase